MLNGYLVLNNLNYFEKSWGYEIWFANTDDYCGKELFVQYGAYSSKGNFHYHKKKDETFYVIRGELKLDYIEDDEFRSVVLKEGQSFRIWPFVKHRFTGAIHGGCNFIEASTHHDESDSYRCRWNDHLSRWEDIENEVKGVDNKC